MTKVIPGLMSTGSYGEQLVQTEARSRTPQGRYSQENERELERMCERKTKQITQYICTTVKGLIILSKSLQMNFLKKFIDELVRSAKRTKAMAKEGNY